MASVRDCTLARVEDYETQSPGIGAYGDCIGGGVAPPLGEISLRGIRSRGGPLGHVGNAAEEGKSSAEDSEQRQKQCAGGGHPQKRPFRGRLPISGLAQMSVRGKWCLPYASPTKGRREEPTPQWDKRTRQGESPSYALGSQRKQGFPHGKVMWAWIGAPTRPPYDQQANSQQSPPAGAGFEHHPIPSAS